MKNTADKNKIFLDTNILLDYLLFRGDEAVSTEYLMSFCKDETFGFFIAAHSLTNIYYILRKTELANQRNQCILNLCALLNVVEIAGSKIERAIEEGYADDLEDALQVQCAVDSGCKYFVTRDIQLFERSPVRTFLPHELIKELSL